MCGVEAEGVAVRWVQSLQPSLAQAESSTARPKGARPSSLAIDSLKMPWPRFMIADVFGGLTTWTAILVSAGVGVLLAALVEGARKLLERIRSQKAAASD